MAVYLLLAMRTSVAVRLNVVNELGSRFIQIVAFHYEFTLMPHSRFSVEIGMNIFMLYTVRLRNQKDIWEMRYRLVG